MSRLIGRLLDANTPQINTNQQYYYDDYTCPRPHHQSRRTIRRANKSRSPSLLITLINAGTEVYMSRKSSEGAANASSRPSSSSTAKSGVGYISNDSDDFEGEMAERGMEEEEREERERRRGEQQSSRQQWSRPDMFGQQFLVPVSAARSERSVSFERRARRESERREWVESEFRSRFGSEEIEDIPPTYEEAVGKRRSEEIAPAVLRRSPLREEFPVQVYEKGRPVSRG